MSTTRWRARVVTGLLAFFTALGTTALMAEPASAHQPRPCPAPKGQSGEGSQRRVDGKLTKRGNACRKPPPKKGSKGRVKKPTTTTATHRS